ncbi:endolytic transglycosylase MltG [Sphingomonas daechungensis]|uniref:endolytic transglycosylase MltG n=1 Tax=Sphingomonas daechungensis TaxID=1176646 RepID=UPI001CB94F3C|nr:endolytic transglycosylase MltG [Sphingomonas daechungensis]
MRSLWRLLALGAAVAVGVAAATVLYGWYGPGPSTKAQTFTVEEGSSVSAVAGQLYKAGLVASVDRFKLGARFMGSGDPVQAGEFEIPKGASGAAILDLLQHGKPMQRLITVTEGMPSIIVEEKLSANNFLTGTTPSIPEGSVLPDSYGYERGETRASVVARMQAAMTKTLDQALKTPGGNCPVSSRQDVLTLASIVEKETGKASERPMVAGVYCNRLRIGMKLDADPTVIYPITKGKPLGRRIKRSELNAITGYNTYREPGLPAGPIANPGKESIAAVLNPAKTNALYFVADGTGGHVFADTLEQHQANVKKWYEIRRQRGEM